MSLFPCIKMEMCKDLCIKSNVHVLVSWHLTYENENKILVKTTRTRQYCHFLIIVGVHPSKLYDRIISHCKICRLLFASAPSDPDRLNQSRVDGDGEKSVFKRNNVNKLKVWLECGFIQLGFWYLIYWTLTIVEDHYTFIRTNQTGFAGRWTSIPTAFPYRQSSCQFAVSDSASFNEILLCPQKIAYKNTIKLAQNFHPKF